VIPLVPGSTGTTGKSPMAVSYEFMLTANPGEDPRTGSGSFSVDFRSPARTKNAELVSTVRKAALEQFGASLGDRDVLVWSAFTD
jgi:hypothetical protein